jgi:hypothetical protein
MGATVVVNSPDLDYAVNAQGGTRPLNYLVCTVLD